MADLSTLLLKKKPVKVVLLLREEGEWYLSELARRSGVTYVYIVYLVKEFAKYGLVKADRKGKKMIVKLTDEGAQIASVLEELNRKLSARQEPEKPKEEKEKKEKPEKPESKLDEPKHEGEE